MYACTCLNSASDVLFSLLVSIFKLFVVTGLFFIS